MSARLKALRERRDALKNRLDEADQTILERGDDFTDEERADYDADDTELRSVDAEIARIEEREASFARSVAREREVHSGITRIEEPELYHERSAHNFLADVYAAEVVKDWAAIERISRHNAHMRETNLELRATDTSDFGGLIVPTYATGLLAPILASGTPAADSFRQLPLTSKVDTISKAATAATVAAINENAGDYNSTESTTTDVDVIARKIAGYAETSVESIEWGTGTDQLILGDLGRSYGSTLEYQVLLGDGNAPNVIGIYASGLGHGAHNASAVAEGEDFIAAIEAAALQVSEGFLVPDTVYVSPRRMHWLRAQFSEKHSVLANLNATTSTINDYRVVVSPWLYTGGVDRAFVADSQQVLVWRRPPVTITIDQPGAKAGVVTFVARGYAKVMSNRYAAAVCTLTDLPTPTF